MSKPLRAIKDYRPRDPMQMLIFRPLEEMTKALLMGDAMQDEAEMRVLERRLRAAADAIKHRLDVANEQSKE